MCVESLKIEIENRLKRTNFGVNWTVCKLLILNCEMRADLTAKGAKIFRKAR